MKKKPPKKAPKRSKRPKETPSDRKPVGKLVPQPGGRGAIYQGAPANPVAGPGRPRSEFRERLRGSLEDRVGIAEEIVDGEPMVRTEVSLAAVLAFAKCPVCEGKLTATVDPADMALIQIEAKTSASPRDRLAGLEFMAKYSVGPTKEISVDAVRDRLRQQILVLQSRLPEADFNRILPELEAIWTG